MNIQDHVVNENQRPINLLRFYILNEFRKTLIDDVITVIKDRKLESIEQNNGCEFTLEKVLERAPIREFAGVLGDRIAFKYPQEQSSRLLNQDSNYCASFADAIATLLMHFILQKSITFFKAIRTHIKFKLEQVDDTHVKAILTVTVFEKTSEVYPNITLDADQEDIEYLFSVVTGG